MNKKLTCVPLLAIMLSACNYNQLAGISTGAATGNMIGSTAGLLTKGYRGQSRGAAIGTIAGAAAGAYITSQQQKKQRQQEEEGRDQ